MRPLPVLPTNHARQYGVIEYSIGAVSSRLCTTVLFGKNQATRVRAIHSRQRFVSAMCDINSRLRGNVRKFQNEARPL